jgi:hypothetical protein
MAPIVQLGLVAAGLTLFLGKAGELVSGPEMTWGERVVAGIVAVVDLGGLGVAGWVAGRLLRAAAEVVDVLVDQAEAAGRTAHLLEWHVAPALERMAVALERALTEPRSRDQGQAIALAGARQAIADHRWEQAERLIEAFARDHPQAPEALGLADELRAARDTVIADLHARLDAAQAAHDPMGVIEFRDALTEHLRGDRLKDLDRHLVQWLLTMIQKRLRTGTAGGDVAGLAARIADSFGDTPEGASLRASLPTLRRSAGLCPRCAQPYTGIGEACPRCLAVGAPTAFQPQAAGPSSQVAP